MTRERKRADLFHNFRELDDADSILELSELKHTVLKFKKVTVLMYFDATPPPSPFT